MNEPHENVAETLRGYEHQDALIRTDLQVYVTDSSTPTFQLVRNAVEHLTALRSVLDELQRSVNVMREAMTPEMLDALPLITRAGVDLALARARQVLQRSRW